MTNMLGAGFNGPILPVKDEPALRRFVDGVDRSELCNPTAQAGLAAMSRRADRSQAGRTAVA
jgi:hypothetical protein